MTENEISNKVIGLAIEVHQSLGPGLLESAYKECLYYKLLKSGLSVVKEKPMPLIFEEVKNEVHLAQTLTYMKLGGFKLGLLINFNVSLVKDGIRRVVNRI
jgi:hypothetical protein